MLPELLGALIILSFAAVALHNHGNHVCIKHTIERLDMSVQAQINAVVAQLHKAKNEIVGKLEEATAGVHAQFVAAGVEEPDLSALTAIAQQLDDLVPDVAEEGTEEVEDTDDAEELEWQHRPAVHPETNEDEEPAE